MGSFLTLQVANGNAFFIGLAVVALASKCRFLTEKKIWRLGARVSAVIGATVMIASATPLALWIYLLWLTLFCFAFVLPARFPRSLLGAFIGLITLSAFMWIHELSYRRTPVIPVRAHQTIFVIGDSISAGIRNEKRPWPEHLRRAYGLDVVNLAQAGATVQSAIQQVQEIGRSNSVAIVEIGGNDFFGATKASDFATNLDQLLALLVKQKHTVAMFELPLLPFHNAFGEAQRVLAGKYHIVLIPKTYMAHVLGKTGATVDGLHLSPSGHEAMARIIYQVLRLEPPQASAPLTYLGNSNDQIDRSL